MKKTFLLLVVIYLAFIALGLPDALLGSAWNLIRVDLDVRLGTLSLVSFMTYLTSLISTYNAPKLLRRFSTKTITSFSIILTGSALIAMSLVGELYQLIIFAVPLGFGAGAIDVSLNHYMAKHFKASHMNFLHSFYGVGVTFGPAIMAYTLSNEMWRNGFMMIGALLLFIALTVVISSNLWIEESNDVRLDDHEHIELKHITKVKGVINSVMIFLIYVHIETLGGVWVASYFFIEKGFGYGEAALFTSIYFLALTIGRFLSGFLAHVLSPKQLILLGESFILTSVILLIVNSVSNPAIYYVIVFLFGFGAAPIYPNMMFLNNTFYTKKHLSKVISLQMSIGYIGFGLFTPLAGALFDLINITIYPYFILVNSLILLMITARYFKLFPKRDLKKG
jgi:fucose permease